MNYQLLAAFVAILTLGVSWIPLGLGVFGSFIVIGAVMYFLPTFLIFIVLFSAVLFTRKMLFTLSTAALCPIIFMVIGIALLLPLALGSIPLSSTELTHSGYWIASLIPVLAGSIIAAILVKKRADEQGGDGDAE